MISALEKSDVWARRQKSKEIGGLSSGALQCPEWGEMKRDPQRSGARVAREMRGAQGAGVQEKGAAVSHAASVTKVSTGFAARSLQATLLKAVTRCDWHGPQGGWKLGTCSHKDKGAKKGGSGWRPLTSCSHPSVQPINHLRASPHQRLPGAAVPAWGPPGRVPRQPRGPRECPDRAAGGCTACQPAGEGGAAGGAEHSFG